MLPLLLEPAELANHLDDDNLLIIDLSKPAIYVQAHVPGAIHLDFKRLQTGAQPAPGMIPDDDTLGDLFTALGLTEDTHVVAYDDEGGGWAGRLLWTLDAIGHRKYSYLNGGIHAWLAEGQPTSSESTEPRPGDYEVSGHDPLTEVDMDYLLAHYQDDDLVLWDSRSEEEFAGVRAFAQKAGHIPGARHYEWTEPMDKQNNLRLRPLDDIRQELEARGITPDKEVICHCQSHHRSSFSWLVAKILGYPRVRGYAGSWAEWGNHPDTPVEKSE
ncbi:thiosulfate sulfurtransferase [Alcanivorax hongdengensis A-11-3]|uniref:Sulfurtransferase n=1 Tax=Alcanivorax hongdengensis A-11-3 TaxID=1177179 RepID=L0WGX7_9GAMM|nr:rhodanese-like domain-containing protein [Alcanivorax hongdengensis]EKF75954.1 thiosulfate sulfurtransferase [Alcanivorax hongdengensis A-11-3]